MTYQVAERFKSVQGEGVYAGTPMAFIRFVGCSVGKKICHHCDTDFERMYSWKHGGEFKAEELVRWTHPYRHICLTGGEPLDQDLKELFFQAVEKHFHIETSGTKPFPKILLTEGNKVWTCVSPKPGYLEEVVLVSDEVKVIVPGLGAGEGWPLLEDALRWAKLGKTVFLQPRNAKFDVDKVNLRYVQDLVAQYPQLRLSVQMHKILNVQ